MNREEIYSALFNKVSGAANFRTTGRKLESFADVPSDEMPALFQLQDGEDLEPRRGIPPRYTLNVQLWIYAHTEGETAPNTVLNPLIDAVEATLAPDPVTGVQTLGLANVSHCWISGRIDVYEGVLDATAIAIIPVNILTT